MISKLTLFLFTVCIFSLAGDPAVVGPSRGHVTVVNSFTTVGRAIQGERCVIRAHSRAVGEVNFGEGFSGNFEGDAGSKTFAIIEIWASKEFEMAIANTREVPNNVTARQRFYHCHSPYQLPYVRMELVQTVNCIDCTATNKRYPKTGRSPQNQ